MGPAAFRALAFLAATACGILAADHPFARLHRPQGRKTVSPAASARFLPARLVADDLAQVERFRVLARTFRRDSTRHFASSGRNLEVSQDLLAEMTGGWGGREDAVRPAGFAAFLATRHGLRLKPGGAAYGAYVPDDKWYKASPQWGLHNEGLPVESVAARPGVDIGIERVWDKFSGSDSLVIAVLDAGYNFRHPELAGRNWINAVEAKGKPGIDDDGNGFVDDSTGWDFVDGDNHPEDFHGHGTYITGVLAANFDDGMGIAGILAQGKVMPVRVLDASGQGDQTQIADGILYAIANGADVINFSIGGGGGSSDLMSAFQAARDKGVPIVAAAGNEALDVDAHPTFPSSYDFQNLVVVGSHGPTGAPSPFSNYGSRVHVAAPGELVLTCGIPDRVAAWQEDFESADTSSRWTFSTGIGISATDALEGGQSLAWSSLGAVTASMSDPVDLAGRQGAVVAFELAFTPSDASDILILEGNRDGSAIWREIAVVGERVEAGSILQFALRGLDGGKVRLRFRTNIGLHRSTANRRLRIDGVTITTMDPAPVNQEVYAMVDGTSIAAPHVAAYVGLQRLACDRMGIPWSRAKALEGMIADPLLAGKVATGGRLDAFRGLQFYLSTLPGLVVRDSTALSWLGGQRVEYALEVSPSQGAGYRFLASGLGSGLQLDTAAGVVSWVSKGPGSYSLKLVADGPTQLRRRLALRILPATTPILALEPAAILRIGNRSFRLPMASAASRRRLEVIGSDAMGRTKILKSAWIGPEAAGIPFSLPPVSSSYPFFQVRLDGVGLEEGK